MLIDLGNGILIDPKQQLEAFEKYDCEESLYTFLRTAWPHMDPEPMVDSWAIEAIAEHLQAVVDGEITRLAINIPPRMGKTSLCSVAFPAWTWAQPHISATSGPQVRFMYASYGESLSLDHSVYCRRLIKSPWYQKHWKDRFSLMDDQDTKHLFGNNKGGERQITSIGSRVTGRGGQIIVIDDPNATNDVNSEAKIKEVVDWWDHTMQSRLNNANTGAFVLIQQRVAENDLTGHILEKHADGWDHLMIPMCYEPERSFYTSIGWKDPRTEPGELLCPERFNETFIAAAKKNPWTFAGQYQQRPEPMGGGVIKRDWWNLWEEDKFPAMDFILASLDTAYTTKTENDYSALTVWGVFSRDTVSQPSRSVGRDGRVTMSERVYAPGAPKLMLMGAWQERLELHELVKKAAETCKKLRVDKLLIENKAAGISVAQELRRLYNNEDWSVQLMDPKSQDKLSRLYSIQHLFAEGMVFAPDKEWADMVITQVGQFPRGKHDDLVDTCSQAIRHMRDLGLLTRSQERLEEIEEQKRYTGKPAEPLYPA